MSFKGFSIFSSGGHFFQRSGTILGPPFYLGQPNHFRNFGRGSPKELFCEIILISSHWSSKRCQFKDFSFSNFSSVGHCVQRSGTILAILVERHPRNISVIFFETGPFV